MSKTIHNKNYQILIQKIMQERVRLNISQSELAAQIGLSQSDISKIEKFERRLDVWELSMILKSLRVKENLSLQTIVKDFLEIPNE